MCTKLFVLCVEWHFLCVYLLCFHFPCFRFSFDGSLHRDAVSKALLTPKTVVLQFVERKETKYGDKFGGKTPLLKSVGAGRAIVLRNGQSFDGTWSRPTSESGTTFSCANSQIAFDVGQVMIVFVDGGVKKPPFTVK